MDNTLTPKRDANNFAINLYNYLQKIHKSIRPSTGRKPQFVDTNFTKAETQEDDDLSLDDESNE